MTPGSTALRDMRPIKEGVTSIFPVGHPCREMILAQPDELPSETLKLLLPTILSLGRIKTEG